MPSICRVGIDRSGNTIVGNLAPTVFINNAPITVSGATILPYGDGCKSNPRTGQGSSTVFAHNKPVVRSGDPDLCGTPCTSTSNVEAG